MIEGIGTVSVYYMCKPLSSILMYELGTRFNYQKDIANLVYKTSEWYFDAHACGEPYRSIFGKEKTQWNYDRHMADYGGTTVFFTYSKQFNINGKNYRKFYKRHLQDENEKVDSLRAEMFGYVREDTIQGKVWYLNHIITICKKN